MKSIPLVQARTFHRKMSSGRTGPALFSCRQHAGIRDYVVKFFSRLGSGILCEIIAGALGGCLGLPTPPVAIVEISPEFAEFIPCKETRETLLNDFGPHFGSEFAVPGYMPITSNFAIPLKLMEQAIQVFCFDMMIQNPDRSCKADRNPNILCNGERFLIYDHELAFPFIRLIGVERDPFHIRGCDFANYHVFLNQIYSFGVKNTEQLSSVIDSTLANFKIITNSMLGSIISEIPSEWRNNTTIEKIENHIQSINNDMGRFKRSLKEALA